MIHEMKLKDKYYNYMLKGTKRIELRLFDEKRQKIKLGDTIRFFNESDLKESFDVKVIGLLKYRTFEELFNDFDISVLSDKSMKKEELVDILSQFYTEEDQIKYGALGIRIELI